MTVLAVNAGSSTLKFALYELDDAGDGPVVLSGSVDGLGAASGDLSLTWCAGANTQLQAISAPAGDRTDRFACALDALKRLLVDQHANRSLRAVAHRVVHGGAAFRQAVVVDADVLAALDRLCPLAPLHQPHNLAGIHAIAKAFTGVPQVACFDTAFHASLPEVEHRFALPGDLLGGELRRYGFHGLSYQYVSETLLRRPGRARGRLVMAHLGSGASVCAAVSGRSQATSMGFSALDGLMMGTRSGSLDAGVLLHLLQRGWDHAKLEHLLYRQCGLLGVSGLSADMRQLRASQDPRAELAIAMFTYRVIREIGALTACVGGVEALAFTGGIGENDARLRRDVCHQLAFLGIHLDDEKNHLADGKQVLPLHTPESDVEVWLVPTDEGRVAAQSASALLSQR